MLISETQKKGKIQSLLTLELPQKPPLLGNEPIPAMEESEYTAATYKPFQSREKKMSLYILLCIVVIVIVCLQKL